MTVNQKMIKVLSLIMLTLGFFPGSFHLQAKEIKIGLIDTGFCPQKSLEILDTNEKKVFIPCGDSRHARNPRLHGDKVFKAIASVIKKEVKFYGAIVYDKKGFQTAASWKKALEWFQENQVDVIISASQLPFKTKPEITLPQVPFFVAAGQVGRGINRASKLFPVEFKKDFPQLIVVSNYILDEEKVPMENSQVLYQDQTDVYEETSGIVDLTESTSGAVAKLAARVLNTCPLKQIKKCLREKTKTRKIQDSPLTIKIFSEK